MNAPSDQSESAPLRDTNGREYMRWPREGESMGEYREYIKRLLVDYGEVVLKPAFDEDEQRHKDFERIGRLASWIDRDCREPDKTMAYAAEIAEIVNRNLYEDEPAFDEDRAAYIERLEAEVDQFRWRWEQAEAEVKRLRDRPAFDEEGKP